MRALPIFLVCLLLAACAPSRRTVRAEPLEPIRPLVFELVPGQTAVERFDPPGAGSTVDLTIGAQVTNPNEFGVTLNRVVYEVFLAGRPVGRGELAPDAFVGAGAQTPLKFRLAVSLEDQPELLRAVAGAFTGTPLAFRIDGAVLFDSRSHKMGAAPVTLLSGETLARESLVPPRLRLLEAESSVFLVRPDAPVVRVTLAASNPGEIGYFLYGRDVTLSLGGREMAVQDVVPVPVPAGQEGSFELLFYPQPESFDATMQEVFGAALEGIPTLLELRGQLLLDVLGVDSFTVDEGWNVSGFLYNTTP